MLFFGERKEGFVLHYEKGRHIRSSRFKVEGFKVNVAALFLPFQLHEEEKIFEKPLRGKIKKRYIMPYGGDVFSLFINQPLMNFFIMDIMGHGLACHKFAEHFIALAIENRQSPSLCKVIGEEWVIKKAEICSKIERELKIVAEELIRDGYNEKLIERNRRGFTLLSKTGLLTACQVIVNLRNMELLFENLGHPSQYCILMGDKGRILGIKSFAKKGGCLGLFPYRRMQESFVIPRKVNRFRIIMFSDAVLEQGLDINPKNVEKLLEEIDVRKLRRNYTRVLTQEVEYVRLETDLLIDTMKHMTKYNPEQFVRFFYKLLIRMNQKTQGDDMTLVVADFERI